MIAYNGLSAGLNYPEMIRGAELIRTGMKAVPRNEAISLKNTYFSRVGGGVLPRGAWLARILPYLDEENYEKVRRNIGA